AEIDQISVEAFLVDNRSAFESGEDGTLGLRKAKTGLDNWVERKCGVDGNQQLIESGPLKSGDGDSPTIVGEMGEFLRRHEIDLIQNLDHWLSRNFQLGQDSFNLSFLLFSHRAGGILDMEE